MKHNDGYSTLLSLLLVENIGLNPPIVWIQLAFF